MKSKAITVLNLMLKTLSELYALDKTNPGIVFSYLPDKGVFYGSVCRYDGIASREHPPDRQVLISVQEPTVEGAIGELASIWIAKSTLTQQFMQAIQPNQRSHEHGNKAKRKSKPAKTRKSQLRTAKSQGGKAGGAKER